MNNAGIVMPLIRGVVHKKLEELVLTAFTRPGFVPPEIIEAQKIAEEHNFLDIKSGIDEIFREVGEIQVRRTLQRIENQNVLRLEREMQDYFIANDGEKLKLIEPGLVYQNHEKVTRAGRLDISARDANGVNVTIELKARDYDAREVCLQLLRYSNEQDGRLIFVAPIVKPELFFTLSGMSNGKKFEFFQVFKNNGDYSVRRVGEEEFDVPKQINWRKAKRTRSDNGLVRVTAEVSKKSNGRKTAVKESLDIASFKFEGGKEIVRGNFDEHTAEEEEFYRKNFPYLSNYFAAFGVSSIKRGRMSKWKYDELESMFIDRDIPQPPEFEFDISEGIHHPLDALVAADNGKARKFWKLKDKLGREAQEEEKNRDALGNLTAPLYLPNEDKKNPRIGFSEEELKAAGHDLGKLLKKRLDAFDEVMEETLQLRAWYVSKDYSFVTGILAKSLKEKTGDSENMKRNKMALEGFDSTKYDAILYNKFFDLKSKRTRALLEIDPMVALFYFVHNKGVAEALDSLLDVSETRAIRVNTKTTKGYKFSQILRWHIIKDDHLYREIVRLFDPIPDEKPETLEVKARGSQERKRLGEEWNNLTYLEKMAYGCFADFPKELEKGKTQEISVSDFDEMASLSKYEIPKLREYKGLQDRTIELMAKSNLRWSRSFTKSMSEICKISAEFNEAPLEAELDIDLGNIDGAIRLYRRMVNGKGRTLRKMKEFFESARRDGSYRKEDEEFLNGLELSLNYEGILADRDYISLKIDRLEKLSKADLNLAYIYAKHTNVVSRAMTRQDVLFDGAAISLETLSNAELTQYFQSDNLLYGQILDRLKPIRAEEDLELKDRTLHSEFRFVDARSHTPAKPNGEGSHIGVRVYHGRDLTNGTKLHHPSESVKWAPEAFAEDVLNNNAYSQSVRDRMVSAVVNSGWYAKGLSDRQVLNFFGDLRVYASQGRVPNKSEIKDLLEKSN